MGSRSATWLLMAATGLLVVAAPFPWFEAGRTIDLSYSAFDTFYLGVAVVGYVVGYAVVAGLVRLTGRQAWFVASLCFAVFGVLATAVLYVSTEVIADVLPLPDNLRGIAPEPGPGLGLAILASVMATVASVFGLLSRRPSGATALRPRPSASVQIETKPTETTVADAGAVPVSLYFPEEDIPEF